MEPTRRQVLVHIVLFALAVRVGLEVVALAATGVDPSVLSVWSRWDAPHYLRIAEVGYRAVGEDRLFIVFFPAFPAAAALVGLISRDLVAAGLIVSFLASVGAGWLLYRMVRLDADHDEAWRAVVLLFLFPTGYFLAAPYTEALFLVSVLGSVYAARIGRWPIAGAVGAIATATRLAGVALLPALAWEAWRARRHDPATRWLWLGLVPAGLVGYLGINLAVHGDPLAFLDIQRDHWRQRPVPPWYTVWRAAARLLDGVSGDFRLIFAGRLGAAVLAVALLVAGWRRLRSADRVYGWAGLILVLSAAWLISLPRYLLGIYPLFVVGAWLTKRREVFGAVVAAGVFGQVWFFWRYAQGWWTF